MRVIKKILQIILNPIGALYVPSTTDHIVKKTNKYNWSIYLISLLLTTGIILFMYRNYIFG